MAITYVGGAVGATDTLTEPAHSSGDLLIFVAGRDGSGTVPGTPSGYGAPIQSAFANSAPIIVCTRVGNGTPQTVTSLNATGCAVTVYRGVDGTTPVGASALAANTADPVSYPALTLQVTDGTSWVVGLAVTRADGTTANLQTPPTGMVLRQDSADTIDEVVIHDTNGGVASWPAQNVTIGAATGWKAVTVELRAAAGGGGAPSAASGSASGAATVTGSANAVMSSGGSATAQATAAGSTNAVVTSSGSAGGQASTSGQGRTIVSASGSASGSSTVSGSTASNGSSGSAAGSATVVGSANKIASATGTASGSAAVAGVGSDASAPVVAVPPPVAGGAFGGVPVHSVSTKREKRKRVEKPLTQEQPKPEPAPLVQATVETFGPIVDTQPLARALEEVTAHLREYEAMLEEEDEFLLLAS